MVINLFENVVKVFLYKFNDISELALRFLSLSFRARDKSKMHYNILVERI